ncbi:BCS1 N terminal-domain-containing protein [Hypomontagnella submonticulosa]|nr:BCS1 N terminal-domain-containing protein [Hypomontagnella submonticulosa]
MGSHIGNTCSDCTFTAENASHAGTTDYLGMLEALLILLGFMDFDPWYAHMMVWLGLNPRYLFAALGIIWALKRVYYFFQHIVTQYFTSSVSINDWDSSYMHLMDWLVSQPVMNNTKHLLAETTAKRAWDSDDAPTLAKDRSGRYLNFSEQEAMVPLVYTPAIGQHSFWWKGRYFMLNHNRGIVRDETNAVPRDQLHIVLSCFGRSPEPIKKILAEAQAQYYERNRGNTTIKRCSKRTGQYVQDASWSMTAARPMRDIETVVLDEKEKLRVLDDINEYLHPATSQWYANRGIPLRRGYLFHGPPGTGKTSLSFALAGLFGLDIHVISLLDSGLTEEDLSNLFAYLPRRCIVLLEDIDAAGLTRPQDISSNDEFGAEVPGMRTNNGSSGQKSKISLSGLLNVIDGVAGHEGRVLIATTNYPEALDPALIRPGRIDMQVAFSNATSQQAKDLFIRMYEPDQSIAPSSSEKGSPKAIASVSGSGDPDSPKHELQAIAEEFGSKIPGGAFSPAEIQGYLLMRKKEPRKALEEADEWVEGMVKQKKLRTKIVQVQ